MVTQLSYWLYQLCMYIGYIKYIIPYYVNYIAYHIISIHHFPSKSEKCLELSKFLHICSSQCRGFFPAEHCHYGQKHNQSIQSSCHTWKQQLDHIYDDTMIQIMKVFQYVWHLLIVSHQAQTYGCSRIFI